MQPEPPPRSHPQRVRALRRAGSSSGLVAVEFDDGDRTMVHERRVGEYGLSVGSVVPPGQRQALDRAAHVDACEQRMLRLIGRRARSRPELERRLDALDAGQDGTREILERLGRLGLIDDAALAEDVVDRLRRTGHGRLKVDHTLRRLQVPDDVTAAVLSEQIAESGADEVERARSALVKRYGDPPLEPADIPRAAAFLGRRGFDAETVSSVLGLDLE